MPNKKAKHTATTAKPVTIPVDRDLAKLFNRGNCIKGRGGYQSLTRTLREKIHGHARASFGPELVDRVHHYRENYGYGGYQQAIIALDRRLQEKIAGKKGK